MNCFCRENETELIFCVEDIPPAFAPNLAAAWFTRTATGFEKRYNRDMQANGVSAADIEAVKANFARLAPQMFQGEFDWQEALLQAASVLTARGIEWYLTGSVCEAVLGVEVHPHDVDIIVHTRDFFAVKSLFPDRVVEPFVDNHGTWLMRYFGRLCLAGAMVDVAADEKTNRPNHAYQATLWRGFTLYIEPLQARYEIERARKRSERTRAIEDFFQQTG